MGMEIAGIEFSLVSHGHSRSKRFSSRRRTSVQDLIPWQQARRQNRQAGRRVLRIEHPGLPGTPLGQVPCSREHQTVRQPGMGRHRHPLLFQRRRHLRGLESASVYLYCHRGFTVVPAEQFFQLPRFQLLAPFLHQPLGVAVQQGEICNRIPPVQGGKLVQMAGQIAENAVDHPPRPGIFAVLLGQLYPFAYRRADGNLGHKKHLVQPQPQVVAYLALHFAQFHGRVLLEIVVQQHAVLDHTKAEAGGQGSIPPV